MKIRFKNRIAYLNTLAAAASTLIAFAFVYLVVYRTAYQHLDADIEQERQAIMGLMHVRSGQIDLQSNDEWDEREHREVEINPTFIQITDEKGTLVFRSANLKDARLLFSPSLVESRFTSTRLDQQRIRMGQFLISDHAGQTAGQLAIAVSETEAAVILQNLRGVLIVAYLFLLLIIYGASSIATAHGIAPIQQLIQTAQQVDEQHLTTRLPLPPRRDELFLLATTINELLDRLQQSLQREKQAAADISHELRTPLAGIRGTLEVLLRRPRTPEHYEEKLQLILLETDRLNHLLEQLLQLSRIEAGLIKLQTSEIHLYDFARQLQARWQPFFDAKQMTFEVAVEPGQTLMTDRDWLQILAENLISNALKYTPEGGRFQLRWDENIKTLHFIDNGPGIDPEKLPYIFNRFYRADDSRTNQVPGTGLGLSIAQQLAQLLNARLSVQSATGAGTTFSLQFV